MLALIHDGDDLNGGIDDVVESWPSVGSAVLVDSRGGAN